MYPMTYNEGIEYVRLCLAIRVENGSGGSTGKDGTINQTAGD